MPEPGSAWWAVLLLAVMAAVITGAWQVGTRRAIRARQKAACDRDVPHDRVRLLEAEQAAWLDFRAWFDLEAEAEEQARMGDPGSETAL